MFVNRNELKAQLVRNNMTASDLAKILGISRQSLSLRMTSKSDFTEKELKVIDSTSAAMCNDNNMPVLVFSLKDPDNIVRAITGEKIGTVITN